MFTDFNLYLKSSTKQTLLLMNINMSILNYHNLCFLLHHQNVILINVFPDKQRPKYQVQMARICKEHEFKKQKESGHWPSSLQFY